MTGRSTRPPVDWRRVATRVCSALGLAALASAGLIYYFLADPVPIAPPRAGSGPVAVVQPDRVTQLSARIAALEHELAAMRSRQASEKSESAARNSTEPGSTAPSSDGGAAETRRAADAEQHRVYIEGLAQSFSNEQIDATWATRASSRISGTLEADATLRGTAHSVECRERTCRVEIADEGSGSLNRRLPMIALGLADLLPNVAAERIDRGDGRSAMVLYMSSQAPGPGPK